MSMIPTVNMIIRSGEIRFFFISTQKYNLLKSANTNITKSIKGV